MPLHSFGGNWTEEKLARLRKYLSAYTTIFHANDRAQYLTTHYVDAFAGTGSRTANSASIASTLSLFEEQDDIASVGSFYAGSARVALTIDPPFAQYLFIEKKVEFASELEQLRDEYPERSSQIQIITGDANHVLQNWCRETNWRRNRAVVFLDPYGMAVNWETVQTLGQAGQNTRGAIDLWVLIPVAQAINRLLPRQRIPTGAWADRLTAFFGTNGWRETFYQSQLRPGLFGEMEEFEKQANFENIGNFFIERLRTVFPFVAENSLALLNSRKVPLFILCFAASNPTAVKIANDVLR